MRVGAADASAAEAKGEVVAPAAAVLQKHGRGLVEREVERTAAGQRERHAAHLAGEDAGLAGREGRREHALPCVGRPAEAAEAGGGEVHAEEDAFRFLIGVRNELRAEGRTSARRGDEARGAVSRQRVPAAPQRPGDGARLRIREAVRLRMRQDGAVPSLHVQRRRERKAGRADGDASVARQQHLDVRTRAARNCAGSEKDQVLHVHHIPFMSGDTASGG